MRGTGRIGSLLRLVLGAAFLCLAWVLFSAAQAEAAEHPAPPALLTSATDPVIAPVAETVDAAADSLEAVAATVPVLEAPVAAVAHAVVTVADDAPVVGRDPLVVVPLPHPPADPLPVELPEPEPIHPAKPIEDDADLPAAQENSPAPRHATVVPRGLALASFDLAAPRTDLRDVAGAAARSSRPAAPPPPDTPGPLPSPQSPMPPTNSVASQGGGAPSGDVASFEPAIAPPHFTPQGSRASDWRLPRGLPDRPGSRPD